MSNIYKKMREKLSRAPVFSSVSPQKNVVFDVSEIPLATCWELYKRDPTCRSSVDLLAASTVGSGFYTSCAKTEIYPRAEDAKNVVDEYAKKLNLDNMLQNMAKRVIACGNDFWLKINGGVIQLPVDAIEKIEITFHIENGVKVPKNVVGYKLSTPYGGGTLRADTVIHWKLACDVPLGFGIGLLQTLLYTLSFNGEVRPAYAAMKAKIERLMPKIFEKYAGPDVLAVLENADHEVTRQFEQAIKNRPEEGAWLFLGGKNVKGTVTPITIDPRARFEYYIDHMVNQFYLGCETPLPRLFSTPGFTEASANAALELQNMLTAPIKREFKRICESEIFDYVLLRAGFDAAGAAVRLNWGTLETPPILLADVIKATELGLIRVEEFRKMATKFGWELWENKQQTLPPQEQTKRKENGRYLVVDLAEKTEAPK